MNRFKTLLLREWLQHRFAWALMMLIPLALAALLTGVGQIELDTDGPAADRLPLVVAVVSITASAVGLAVIATIASLITVIGLARRDHGDRSHEYWLSLPIGHGTSFAAPLLVHLLFVPAAALLVGWAGGLAISMVTTTRVVGFADWLALPWGDILGNTLALALRVIAGLPLALAWLSPLILLTVLLCAWFRRWGLLILAVALIAGSMEFAMIFGRPLIAQTVLDLLRNAAEALFYPDRRGVTVRSGEEIEAMLNLLPGWVLQNFGASLAQLASPLLAGALLVAAGCYAGLIDWRRRGSSAAS